MIPRDYITEWRAQAPWEQDAQVEQDLVISRALVELFSHRHLAEALAFRGGTALYKLHILPAARYSEDIDLVQVRPEPIGDAIDALRSVLDPWLGTPQRHLGEGRVTLGYRFASEDTPPLRLRLKIEINSREHFTLFGLVQKAFEVRSRWFTGRAAIPTYTLDELLGTKLRALYQRRKGRDLFDIALGLRQPGVDPARIVQAFEAYLEHEGAKVTRALFERNMAGKMENAEFIADAQALLSPDYRWDMAEAMKIVSRELIKRLPGGPWKGEKPTP